MEIEVGDVVCFFIPGNKLLKKGQVIRIEDDEADIWCTKEQAVYRAKLSDLKKIQ